MSMLAIILSIYFGIICGIAIAKSDESVTELKTKPTKAKELCDKLEHSMCALAGGKYNLRYNISD